MDSRTFIQVTYLVQAGAVVAILASLALAYLSYHQGRAGHAIFDMIIGLVNVINFIVPWWIRGIIK